MFIYMQDIKELEKYTLWRKRNKVTLSKVAHYCGCSISLLSLWERGQKNISESILCLYNEYIRNIERKNGKIAAK